MADLKFPSGCPKGTYDTLQVIGNVLQSLIHLTDNPNSMFTYCVMMASIHTDHKAGQRLIHQKAHAFVHGRKCPSDHGFLRAFSFHP